MNGSNDILYARMRDEYSDFTERLRAMEADEIIAHSYEKVFKEDILMCVDEEDLLKKK